MISVVANALRKHGRGLVFETDARDRPWDLGSSAGKPQDLRDIAPSIRDQRATSECVGASFRMVVGGTEREAGLTVAPPSDMAAYRNARLQHLGPGEKLRDDGAYIRACYSAAGRYGCPSEDAVPFNPLKINAGIPAGKAVQGYSRKGLVYEFVGMAGLTGKLLAIERAASQRRVMGFGVQVSERFQRHRGPGVFDGRQRDSDVMVGGHAMSIFGMTAAGNVIVANSWGTGWGDGGFVICAPEWVADWRDLVVVSGWDGLKQARKD